MRADGRAAHEIRPLTLETGFIRYPEGSVLYRAGDTVVLCNVSLSDRTPGFLRGTGEGWVTAEYATHDADLSFALRAVGAVDSVMCRYRASDRSDGVR